jgi:hypothetical protein
VNGRCSGAAETVRVIARTQAPLLAWFDDVEVVVQRRGQVHQQTGHLDVKRLVDMLERVARRVVIGVVLDAGIEERDARLVRRPMAGAAGPVLDRAGRPPSPIVPTLEINGTAPGHLLDQRF